MSICSRAGLCCFLAVSAFFSSLPVAAQVRSFAKVVVVDTAGRPVEGAFVSVGRSQWRTGLSGVALLEVQDQDSLSGSVRALGFGEEHFIVRVGAEVRVVMHGLQLVTDLVITDVPLSRASRGRLAGFTRRRAQGGGSFIDRAAIDARGASRTVDLLRAVPGIRITYQGNVPFVRFARCAQVEVYINGFRSTQGFPDLFAISPLEIEALEVYHGVATVPPEFSPHPSDCAAVVAWTR